MLRLAYRLPAPILLGTILGELRRAEARRQLAEKLPFIASLSPLVVSRDPLAVLVYDEAVAAALEAVRDPEVAGPLGLLSTFDRLSVPRWSEYCDDVSCPEDERTKIIDALDWMNEGLESYDRWMDFMEEDLRPLGRPTRVLDLAAGHGGFARALKARFGAAIDVTASDVCEAYLDLGREAAAEQGLDVAFRVLDATYLEEIADGEFDVIVCTQSLHHFRPGMVARIMGESGRVASRAAWFIDAERTVVGAALLGLVVGLYSGSWRAVHDTVVSYRKMFAEEELAVLAALAPGMPPTFHLETKRCDPGFVCLRAAPPNPKGRETIPLRPLFEHDALRLLRGDASWPIAS